MKNFFAIIFLVFTLFMSMTASAKLELPNYAADGEDLKTHVETKGKNVTKLLSLGVAIVSIIGMLIGAGYFGIAEAQKGRQWFLGGCIGLALGAMVYAIAALMV